MTTLNIVMAQMNTLVGDFRGNTTKIIDTVSRAQAQHRNPVVVFPELTLCGYPPEDLLLRDSIKLRVDQSLKQICEQVTGDAHVVIGYPRKEEGSLYNVAGVIHRGRVIAEYRKQHLPNYQVFDEKRYFCPGDSPCIVSINGIDVALSICEDIWEETPTVQAATAGARLMINLNASPYHLGKQGERRSLVSKQARIGGFPIGYVNQVGGQDELVFDGG